MCWRLTDFAFQGNDAPSALNDEINFVLFGCAKEIEVGWYFAVSSSFQQFRIDKGFEELTTEG